MSASTPNARARTRSPERTLLSVGAGVLLLAWVMAPAMPVDHDCELTFEPPQVQVGSESTAVHATPSEEIGEVSEVTADPRSGLEISFGEEGPLSLEVNASEAVAGSWLVALSHDGESVCSGALRVVEGTR
jgi:hypothetical protein